MGVINPVNRFQETVAVASDQFTASLANGASLQTPWLDFSNIDKYQVNFNGDSTGLTFTSESRDNENQTIESNGFTYSASNLFLGNFPARQRFMRFTLTNSTGSPVTSLSFVIRTYVGSSDKTSVFPLSISPRPFSAAMLTQSVNIGQDYTGVFRNTAVNTGGAILTADFGTDVSLGVVPNYSINTKFGRNNDIDTGSTPQDVWNGGGSYTGFDCVAAQTLNVVSSSTSDRGTQLSSGTASTSSSGFILVDDAANFTGDGVDVGNIVLNDTQGFYGIVTSVDNDTQLTVRAWYDGSALTSFSFAEDDVYRIAEPASTGAAVVQLNGLNSSYVPIKEYVILNGTTTVTTTKTFLRQDRGVILIAGTATNNVGEITARQSTSTIITMVMPAASGQSAIACTTIPSGKIAVVKHLECAMVIDGNQSGSAQVQFQVRNIGGAWQTKRFAGISNANDYDERLEGGILIDSGSDVRWRVQSVSNNNTQVTGLFEYFLIDV